MSRRSQLKRRLGTLESHVSGLVDCLHETKNNLARGEWDFAKSNLRILFRNATVIHGQRQTVLRELTAARRKAGL